MSTKDLIIQSNVVPPYTKGRKIYSTDDQRWVEIFDQLDLFVESIVAKVKIATTLGRVSQNTGKTITSYDSGAVNQI